MDKTKLYEIAEEMENMFGSESLLEQLLKAMDCDELKENLEYIDRMNGTGLF